MAECEEASRPRPQAWVRYLGAGAFAVLFLPLVTLLVYAFLEPVATPNGTTYHLSLVWFQRLFGDVEMGQALGVSLQIAATVSVVASLLGTLGALAIERGRFPGRQLLALATLLPLVLPELVLGLSSVIWFSVLRLTLGRLSIILAHVTFTVSYVVVTVRARLRSCDPTLVEAANDLGASPWQAFYRVTLPLMAPGIAAGAMMAFTLSLDDFLISFFTAGVGSDTLPMKLYAMIRFGLNREMYALSAVLMLVTGFALAAQLGWQRRPKRRTTQG